MPIRGSLSCTISVFHGRDRLDSKLSGEGLRIHMKHSGVSIGTNMVGRLQSCQRNGRLHQRPEALRNSRLIDRDSEE